MVKPVNVGKANKVVPLANTVNLVIFVIALLNKVARSTVVVEKS